MSKIFDKVSYDTLADACYVTIQANLPIHNTIQTQEWYWVDIDEQGKIVGIEILNVSKHYAFVNKLLLSDIAIDQCILY